jgi:predicted nucleic-acid-binding Zn-ribbon protein
MATDLVQAALRVFDGMEFSDRSACPSCGGAVQGYDTRKKRFAVILEESKERILSVSVKRFICKSCKKLCYADEPFYPDTRIGSPVIDLYLSFCTTMPKSRAARMIGTMGISVDRTTWRNYHPENFPDISAADFFGMNLPFSILTISSLAASTSQGSGIKGAELLAACGFPSAYRAALHHPVTGEKGE